MILITGATGLLGSSLMALAQEQSREVVGLYYRHEAQWDGAKVVAADLTDESRTREVFAEFRPSMVVHCAAETNVDWCQEHSEAAEAINVAASGRIAEIAAETGIRMLYVSTDSVFDGNRGQYAETDIPAPVNLYAETKLRGEKEVLDRNPSATIARLNLYGWNAQRKESLAEWVLGQLRAGNDVPGFTDAVFCPMLANDLAEILLAMLDQELVGLYHVVGSEAVSKFEFARRVAAIFGFDPEKVVPARLAAAKLKAPRPLNTSLNTEKICDALGRPMPDVDSGLHRFAQLRDGGYLAKIRGEMTEARP